MAWRRAIRTIATAVFTCACATIAGADTWSLTIPATANLYGAGHSTPPGPDGNGAGVLPNLVMLPAGTARVLRVISASGSISYTPSVPPNGPDGVASGSLAGAFDWDGIAGCPIHRIRHVSGVFLDDTEPADPPPAELVADSLTFHDLFPALRQIFPIGDGLTGTAVGDTQRFVVPGGATRLFLGFVDSFSGTQPGWYGDNSGSADLVISVLAGQSLAVGPRIPPAFRLLAPDGNALRGGVRIAYELPRDAAVRVEIFDLSGRRVRDLGGQRNEPAGLGERSWDGAGDDGVRVHPGIFVARVRTSVGTGSVKTAAF
jgi:hypothetical protein